MNISIATFDPMHAAQADVAGAGDNRPRTTSQRRRVIINAALGLAALLGLVAGVLLLTDTRHDVRSSTDVATVETATPPAIQAEASLLDDPASVAQSPAPVDVPALDGIERQSADIVIDLHGQPCLQAAQLLAALTDSQLVEGTALLARAAPVTLQWRGRDPLEAWRQLLGENIRHVVHCQAGRCRVWVLALNASAAATASNDEAADEAAADDAATDESRPTPTAPVEPEPPAETHVAPMNTPTPPDE